MCTGVMCLVSGTKITGSLVQWNSTFVCNQYSARCLNSEYVNTSSHSYQRLTTYTILQHTCYIYTHKSLKLSQVHNIDQIFTYIQKLRCCSHPGHYTHSGRNPVTHMFLIQASTSYYDSPVLCQITCDTQKLYGHKSTMHPVKTCYT